MLLHPNYWLVVSDYEDKNVNKIKDIKNYEQDSYKYEIKQDERVDAEEHCKRNRRIFRYT